MRYKTEKEVIDAACDLMFDLMDRVHVRYQNVDKAVLAAHINTLYIRVTKDLYFNGQKSANERWSE